MKKRKFNILLNIAVLCMCVCAIAIGVYSAKTASLNVSGTIGFTAHNCDVYVYGKVEGGNQTGGVAEFGTSTSYINVNNDTDAWELGTLTFDDLNDVPEGKIAKDIVFTIKMRNESAFDVVAEIIMPLEFSSYMGVNYEITGATTSSGGACVLSKDKTEVTAKITLSLLLDSDMTAKDLSGFSIKFAKPENISNYESLLKFTEVSGKKQMTIGCADNTYTGEIVIPVAVEKNNEIYLVTSFSETDPMEGPVFMESKATSIVIPVSFETISGSGLYMNSSIKTITLSYGLKSFGNLGEQQGITNIVVPSSVTNITSGAFSDTSLKEITIPSTVVSIGSNAFQMCGSLTKINFIGTKAQWKAIEKTSFVGEYTGDYTVYCSDGNITKAEDNA